MKSALVGFLLLAGLGGATAPAAPVAYQAIYKASGMATGAAEVDAVEANYKGVRVDLDLAGACGMSPLAGSARISIEGEQPATLVSWNGSICADSMYAFAIGDDGYCYGIAIEGYRSEWVTNDRAAVRRMPIEEFSTGIVGLGFCEPPRTLWESTGEVKFSLVAELN